MGSESSNENIFNFAKMTYFWGCFIIFSWSKQIQIIISVLCSVSTKKIIRSINERNIKIGFKVYSSSSQMILANLLKCWAATWEQFSRSLIISLFSAINLAENENFIKAKQNLWHSKLEQCLNVVHNFSLTNFSLLFAAAL